MVNKELRNKWVGLVEVTQLDHVDVFGENRGATVTVVAFCDDECDYERVVERALIDIGLVVVHIEDVETCEHRFSIYDVGDEFENAVRQVSLQNPVAFMAFHTFPLECH